MNQPLSHIPREAVVLLVEDNPDHAFLAKESFADAKLRVNLHHVESGDHCMAFLRRQPPYENAPRPDLILLDIHMPRMDGYEVMETIVKDQELRSLVVVVMTTSADALDVERMYALRCNSYVVKPLSFESFTAVIQRLSNYWFDLVVLPQQGPDNA